jgi:hypothetical protein
MPTHAVSSAVSANNSRSETWKRRSAAAPATSCCMVRSPEITTPGAARRIAARAGAMACAGSMLDLIAMAAAFVKPMAVHGGT